MLVKGCGGDWRDRECVEQILISLQALQEMALHLCKIIKLIVGKECG